MPHITKEELDQLNREVDLVALVRSKGVELKPDSNGSLIGRSPFKKEKCADSPSIPMTTAGDANQVG